MTKDVAFMKWVSEGWRLTTGSRLRSCADRRQCEGAGIAMLDAEERGIAAAASQQVLVTTTFDDLAAVPVGQGSAPFNGSFRPDAALAGFKGKSANGVWRLWVDDQVGNGNGAILSWSLTFNAQS